MENIYDNGCQVIGEYKKVVAYVKKHQDNLENDDLLEDLIDLKLDDNTIICINYDLGMGYSFDWWDISSALVEDKDIIEDIEEIPLF